MQREDLAVTHELSHGVTQYSANLAYDGQSGALNESISDVFGALVEQHAKGQSAAEASWLIGEGLFTDQVQGSALRSMQAVAANDTGLARGIVITIALGFVVINLLVDILYLILNPRLRGGH